MNLEAKVGAFTLAGLALLAGVVIMLSGFKMGGEKGYTLYAGFKEVVGVEPQSLVRLSGVPIGKVKSVENDGQGVTVTMQINEGVQIPKDSQVGIGSSGIMSDKYINISPGDASRGFLSEGDYLTGTDEAGMGEMFNNANKIMLQAQELLASMNSIVGNGDFQTSIIQMAVNMRDATAHLNGMMAAFDEIIKVNQGNINQIMSNMNAVTASLGRTMNSVEAMMSNLATVGADPQTAENLRLTLDNIAQASEKVRLISEDVAKVTHDEKTVEDVKATIHNAREITEKAKNAKKKLESIKTSGELSALYSGSAHDWDTNWNFTAAAESGNFLTVGLEDMGESNRVNFQVGKRKGALSARAGAIHGDAGVGLDAYAGDNFKFSVDAYDFDDTRLRLGAQYRLKDKTWLMGQWQNVNDSRTRAAYVGIRQAF